MIQKLIELLNGLDEWLDKLISPKEEADAPYKVEPDEHEKTDEREG